MDNEIALQRLQDQVSNLQNQINTLYVSPGATVQELARVKKLEDQLAARDAELATLKLTLADVNKRLSALPDMAAVTGKVNKGLETAMTAVGDVISVHSDRLMDQANQRLDDASINFKRAADKAQAASEASINSATAFIRRSLHTWAS